MTNTQDFVLKSLSAKDQPQLKAEGSIFPTLFSVAQTVIQYHLVREGKDHDKILETRRKIGDFADKFWRNAQPRGELAGPIQEKLGALVAKDPEKVIVLMSAHQPNLFPYSGVTRKIAFLTSLAKLIEKITNGQKEVVCFFGIADHDFVHNKWIRSAEMPAPLRRDGILRFNLKVSQKDLMLPSNAIPKPSTEILESWKDQIESWIKENSTMAKKYRVAHKSSSIEDFEQIASTNFQDFWKLVKEVHSTAGSVAEFNARILARVAYETWRVPVLFANFSDCFTILGQEYLWMLDHAADFANIVSENENRLKTAGLDSGLSEDIGEIFPLWLKCDCGSKYRLQRGLGNTVEGKCVRCGSDVIYPDSQLRELALTKPHLFEPRSIAMPMTFARGFDMSCYVGGIGGLGYLMHSRRVSEKLQSSLPPTPFWYVDDLFDSLELLCSAQQVEKLAKNHSVQLSHSQELDYNAISENCSLILSAIQDQVASGKLRKGPETERDRQLLSNIKTSLRAKGCTVDYVINVGLAETFAQWSSYLEQDGNLHSPVKLKAAF